MSTAAAAAAAAAAVPSDAQAQDQQPQNLKIVFPPTSPPQHRRGYQACDPCRKRKVKCDLGSVDNPRPPPCVRCRRESKRCEFSATRRKRKASEDADDASNQPNSPLRRDKRMMVADGSSYSEPVPTPAAVAATATNNGPPSFPPGESSSLKSENGSSSYRQWHDISPGVGRGSVSDTSQTRLDTSLSPTQVQGYNRQTPSTAAATYPGLPPRTGSSSFLREGGQHMMNKTAAELLSPAISNSHDALHLLSEAAGRTEDLNRQSLENRYAANQSASSTFGPQSPHMARPNVAASRVSSSARIQKPGSTRTQYQGVPLGSAMPNHDAAQNGPSAGLEDPDYLSAMRAWSRLRFVRAGWFTVDEAMAYIAYFYKHLSPLTPIVLPNYSLPSTHVTLLTDEPILTVTLLTIASRHMKLSGNGAKSRAYSIHERLWSYLRGMIERLFWGQEKFGGSVSGINLAKYREVFPPTGKGNLKGHLRSLGTVEALLLLTDWHPRALHFPPGDDENTLLDMDAHILSHVDETQDDSQNPGKGNSDTPLALYKWLEPAWRSDRMSWMLLSTAQALAFELGVFDQKNESDPADSPASQTRKRRVRRLILVYVTQSSGRLGISSMLPLSQWTKDTDPLVLDDSIGLDINDDASVDAMHDCWMEISKIMSKTNQALFLTKEQTSELIRSGRYRDEINEFMPWLREYRQKFDRLPMAEPMRNILIIEYEYTRLYVNCLALQAVVDRWTTMPSDASATSNTGGPIGSESTPAGATSGTGPFRVLMEQYRVNEPYIQEVVDASRKILQTVLDGLAPGNCLQHAPVRTYFRILSGMIFILKTFTLGAKEDDVRVSLELQDRTVECLRTCVVDDVHLSVTISDLLQLLTANIRTRFLRFAPFDRAGDDGRETSLGANGSHQQSPPPQDGAQSRGASNNQWQPNLDGYSVENSNSGNSNNIPTTTPVGNYNDPLANIPAQPINSSSNLNVSFMPPPASFYHNYYDTGSTPPTVNMNDPTLAPQAVQETNGTGQQQSGNTNSAALPDWFALPLDQFFNSSTAGVDQGLGGTGPMVGELDMLEVLLNEHYDRDGAAGGGGSGQPQQQQQSHFM